MLQYPEGMYNGAGHLRAIFQFVRGSLHSPSLKALSESDETAIFLLRVVRLVWLRPPFGSVFSTLAAFPFWAFRAIIFSRPVCLLEAPDAAALETEAVPPSESLFASDETTLFYGCKIFQ